MKLLKLKGMDKLYEKLPAYQGKRLGILILRAALGALLAYLFLITLDIIPRFFSDITILALIEPLLPFIGSLVVAGVAIWLISSVWNKREETKEKFGALAYQKMFPMGLVGVGLIPPLVFHAFTSIRSLPLINPVAPVNDLTTQMSTSLLQMLGVPHEIDIWLRLILSAVFFLFGLATMRSSILTFGMDYMAVVYLYFPEESEVQDHAIYSVIRHPAYLSASLMAVGGLFSRFSVYSILLALIVYLVLRNQISREEKELIERFGDEYIDYRKRVPTLLVRPSKFREYLRFLKETF